MDTSVWNAILSAGPVVQLVMLLLVIMSISCWALIWAKWNQLKKVKLENEEFIQKAKKRKAEQLALDSEDLWESTPLARVFLVGYQRFRELTQDNSGIDLASAMEMTEKEMLRRIRVELGLLESHLGVLASTGSVAPFIGLFGTVWGILGSFQKIGAMGSASLAVVAPGIAEALVATAVGLFAAIPATLFYNHFVTKIRAFEVEMNDWAGEFLILLKSDK
ncbi:MAG: MotA/TolQ/ExbB proton channel family protein [Bdellovibrionaceae bacterium]|nr:MotA/TolQ/ExbB proton channel family protein [Pseudobdellovibrionaceae bacterium]